MVEERSPYLNEQDILFAAEILAAKVAKAVIPTIWNSIE